ncbi:MAG: hypothetical protein ICV73_29175 [Acetobacteraceae bacterium]|nr:hypothetical protein [Acetobacteraceae bacterium]
MGGRPEWAQAEFRAGVVRVRTGVVDRRNRPQNASAATRDEDAVNFGAARRAERIALDTRERISATVRRSRRPQPDIREIRGEP